MPTYPAPLAGRLEEHVFTSEVLRGNPRDWYDVYRDTFDYLHRNEPTSYLNLTVHCHFGGRPLMAAMVDKILKYIRGFPDVWIVRHDELANG